MTEGIVPERAYGLYRQWRIQRVHCRGGRNQIGAKRRRGRVREGETPSCRWVFGGPPPGKFLKNGCKWCILSPFFAEFVLITSPKIVCNFCPQSSDLRHTCCGKISNLAVEDHIQQKRGVFMLLQ